MDTPPNWAGTLTERVMRAISPHLKPNTPEANNYNRAYEAVYAELLDAEPAPTRKPQPGFDCSQCSHRHQDESLGFICVGCLCPMTGPI